MTPCLVTPSGSRKISLNSNLVLTRLKPVTLRLLLWSKSCTLSIICFTAWQFSRNSGDLITLAFSMTTYTLGPMLGLFALSILSTRFNVGGLAPAVALSMLGVLIINEPELFHWVLPTTANTPLLAWPWLFPIGTLLCVLLALRGRKMSSCV